MCIGRKCGGVRAAEIDARVEQLLMPNRTREARRSESAGRADRFQQLPAQRRHDPENVRERRDLEVRTGRQEFTRRRATAAAADESAFSTGPSGACDVRFS